LKVVKFVRFNCFFDSITSELLDYRCERCRRYYVVVKLLRRLGDVIVQHEVVVHVPSSLPEVTRSVKTEVGIGDKLRLELECNKWKYAFSCSHFIQRLVLC